MTKLLLGIDAGNFKAKVASVHGVDSFKTNICGWFERDVQETFGEDDMSFEIDGRKGYAGSIAEAEDEFGDGTRYGDSKAHDETKIRVLLAIHRYMEKYNLAASSVYIVTGQPIATHKEGEKQLIIDLLKGKHDYVVNGKRRKITIEDVKVSPEGSAAFLSNPNLGNGILHIIDVGSGTVNMATVSEKRFIHKSSGTMDTGIETLKNRNDLEGMSRGIIQATTKLKWKKDDTVFVCGGIANLMLPHLQKHYVNAEVLKPLLATETETVTEKPIYANAIAFYNIAKGVYK